MVPEKRFYTPKAVKGKKSDSWPQANIYMSPEFYNPTKENAGKTAVVLIQGKGPTKCGMWANSVSVNDNLELGSFFP